MIMEELFERKFEERHAQWREKLAEMAGGEDITGIEMVTVMRMTMHFIDAWVSQHPDLADLSGPRMGILMRLLAEEDRGNTRGINPTLLSHYQNVKKNTVSSLVSGLEEQGLVERVNNPEDRRGYYIRLTPAGRERIVASMPTRMKCINAITAGLTREEKEEMIAHLNKLRTSLMVLRHNKINFNEITCKD